MKPARSALLDLVRVLAITMVLVAHLGQLFDHPAGEFFGIKNLYFVSVGGLGVTLFLLLSGVLVGLSRPVRRADYGAYLYKRVKRIYPLYWLSIPIAILGVVVGGLLLDGSLPDMVPNSWATEIIGSLTGFYAWVGLWGGPYNPPTWYISLIVSLYILAPLLYWLIERSPRIALLSLLCVSLFSRLYIGENGIPFVDDSFLDQAKGWLWRQYGFWPGRPGDWFILCRIFEFSLGIYLGLYVKSEYWFALNLPLRPLLARFSDLSFPVFLVHFPLLFIVQYLVGLGVQAWGAVAIYIAITLSLARFLEITEAHILYDRKFAISSG